MILRSQARKLAVFGSAATFLLLPTLVAARFNNDFSEYPRAAISCLEDADKNSGCNADEVVEMNQCLCSDGGGFLTNSAKCIGEKSADDLETAYAVFKINCDNTKTPMKFNLAEFLDLAKGDAATTPGYPSNTGGAQPTETESSDDGDKGGLSMGAIIGIAVGAGVLVLGALAAAVIFCMKRRKRRNMEESHPMLVNQSYNPGAFPAAPSSVGKQGMYHSPNDVKAESSNPGSPTWRPTTQSPPPGRPSPHSQQQAWNDPRHTSWNSQQSWGGHQSWTSATPPYHTLGSQGEQQQQQQPPPQHHQQLGPPVFELPHNPATQPPQQVHQPPPVEMPASPLDPRQQQQQGGGYGYGQRRY